VSGSLHDAQLLYWLPVESEGELLLRLKIWRYCDPQNLTQQITESRLVFDDNLPFRIGFRRIAVAEYPGTRERLAIQQLCDSKIRHVAKQRQVFRHQSERFGQIEIC